MDPERYQRLKELVNEALAKPEFERDVFLQRSCDDPEMLAAARDLLHPSGIDDEGTEGHVLLTNDLPDLKGPKLGSYKILELLGEGGMGVVYLAAQSSPLRRKVALKVIKLGMDTREVITRFESERQALALMDHPNIAKVFDAGATNEGRPFFAMEYIPGVPITQYCEDKSLGLRPRLDLFIQVCQGVQHAHQKGVIHRDLKPGNILVTEIEGKPVPKIIDFGVAKATTPNLAAQTLFTRMGQMIGTPEYMSPEQADSSLTDVDTRSDVYSLGVILYEMLTGVLPLERRDILQAGLKRMALHVQNEVPKKPSTRIDTESKLTRDSTHFTRRDTRLWVKRVRGDLDWITMKALEKEPDRRYGSAADLAADLDRHLASRAVSAGPPSGFYRVGKFVQRNRVGVGIAGMALVALIVFTTWLAIQSQIITRERDKAMANERLSHARALADKDPTVAIAYALSSLEILDQPATRGVVRTALARAPIRNELPRWGQGGNPISVDSSPDGKTCAVPWSGVRFPAVGIYSLDDYSMQVLTAPTPGTVFIVDFNSDGSHVIANGGDGEGIHVWRISDGKHLHHLAMFGEFSSSDVFRLSDPRKMAVSANNPGEPTLWFELDIHEGTIRKLGQSIGFQVDQAGHAPAINPEATWIMDYDEKHLYLQRVEDLDKDRAILVGQHDNPISTLAVDASCETAISMDTGGVIKAWDLTQSPPRLIRKYEENPGTWNLKFDPYGQRFLTSWGSETVHVYDLTETPKRQPVPLLDRTHWAHDGTFLPDGSLVTSNNGGSCSVSHFTSRFPLAWSLDLSEIPGEVPDSSISPDGKVMYLWTAERGEVIGLPLASGPIAGTGFLGRTPGWTKGVNSRLITDPDRNRCLTYSHYSGTQMLDFNDGTVQDLTGLPETHLLWNLSASGRFAGIVGIDEVNSMIVFDLDSMKIASMVELGSEDFLDFCIAGDTTLLVAAKTSLTSLDLKDPTASPDTLWQGDSAEGGWFLDHGNSVLVRDGELQLSWLDLTNGEKIFLGKTPVGRVNCVDYQPGLGLIALGGWSDTIKVFDLKNGKNWSLPVPGEGQKYSGKLHIDPLGRWLISKHLDRIIAWKLPLDPLFEDLEYDELLESLRLLTNVRVTPDETKENGFRVTNTTDPDS